MTSEQIKILVVDDEEDIREILKFNLEKEDFKVYTASDGTEGKKVAKKAKPDLIILDVMMPGMDGIELCNELRDLPEFEDVLIVFLSARGEDYSQIAGFVVGADDYITKPVRPRVLIARIKALLKRKFRSKTEEAVIEIGELIVDKGKRDVQVNGKSVHLPKIEFELLLLFATNPGLVFSREDIYSKIWGYDVLVSDRTLDVHIRKLREKIGKDLIKTIKGVGYGFNA